MPLIAFSFASPWLLWGLALGAAPIVIHLLNRRKFKETQWAAMRFLLEAVRKHSRRLRIEQLVLLAVRTLLLVLLVSALAQPLVEQLGAFFQPSQPAHKIIVIDASLSMGLQVREQTLFDRARDVAGRIAEAARQGDAFNLVRLSNIPPAAIVPTPAFQPAKVVEEIEQMQLPHGRGNLLPCLARAADLLKAAPELPQKEVFIVSDFQRATWACETADDVARLRALLKQIDEAGRLVLVDLGQTGAANLAVSRFEAAEEFVATGRPVRFRATVHNYGDERIAGRGIEFFVDDRLIEQRSVEINPGADALEAFSHDFSTGGEHRVRVQLQKDSLPLDDQRWLAIPVKDHLRVLCVNGRPAGQALGKATGYLELALAPQRSAAGMPPAAASRGSGFHAYSLIEPRVVNEGELLALDLNAYDCVFLCDVPLFTDREARLLETYLRGGGGVVWCLGPQVQADNYNQTLYRDGAGILPAKLGDRVGNLQQVEEAFAFDAREYAHPIVNPFEGNPGAGLLTTQTYAYLRATPSPQGAPRVALAFDTGDPAIIEAGIGRGRSILVTTSVDDAWGVWPLWPSFLPLIHEIVEFAVAGRWGERQRLVGESLSGVFPAAALDVDVSVAPPEGPTLPAHVTADDSLSAFSFDATAQSGIYAIEFSGPPARRELFSVNVDARESNLAKYSQEELARELLPGVDFDYDTNWQDRDETPAAAPIVERGGLTRWLLYAALYLLFVEQMLAWNFRWGLYLLCPLLAPFALALPRRKPAPSI